MRNTLNLRFSFLIAFLLFMPMMIHAFPPEGITIRARVTDEALKEAVPGANVTVKGITIGTITGFDGTYSIVVPSKKDRKSTRLNSSHANISYAVFCLKK